MGMGLVTTLSGCNQQSQQPSTTTTNSAPATTTTAPPTPSSNLPVVKVGISADYTPYEFYDEKKMVGFDVDVMNAVQEKLHQRVEFVPINFDNLFTLLGKDYDIAISGLANSPERKQKYSISQPYAAIYCAIVVKDNRNDINTVQDLMNPTVKVSVDKAEQFEVAKETDAKAFDKFYQRTDKQGTTFLAFQKVVKGEADAVLGDELLLRYNVKLHPEAKVKVIPVTDYFTSGSFIAVSPLDKPKAVEDFNKGFTQIVQDGTYDKIYMKWFGINAKPLTQ